LGAFFNTQHAPAMLLPGRRDNRHPAIRPRQKQLDICTFINPA